MAAPLPSDVVKMGALINGRATAKVAMIEFSDFECDYCSRFVRETLPALESKYVAPGLLAISFRHFPNERSHPHSVFAAEVASCAASQGRFWEMHNALFRTTPLDRASIRNAAAALNLSGDGFAQCLLNEADGAVARDTKDAIALHVTGTPSFLIGMRDESDGVVVTARVAGAMPLSSFTTAIDAALQRRPSEARLP